jgi:hypothetical protein
MTYDRIWVRLAPIVARYADTGVTVGRCEPPSTIKDVTFVKVTIFL